MQVARLYIEQLLTNSVHLIMFYGSEVDKELEKLQPMVEEDQPTTEYIVAWRATLNLNEVYRRSEIQNRLLDLWGLVAEATEAATEPLLSA